MRCGGLPQRGFHESDFVKIPPKLIYIYQFANFVTISKCAGSDKHAVLDSTPRIVNDVFIPFAIDTVVINSLPSKEMPVHLYIPARILQHFPCVLPHIPDRYQSRMPFVLPAKFTTHVHTLSKFRECLQHDCRTTSEYFHFAKIVLDKRRFRS